MIPFLADSAGALPEVHKRLGPADIIMPHLTDSKHLELPCVRGFGEWACEVTLPTWNVHIAGRTIDMGPTKHIVFLLLSAVIAVALLVSTARAHVRHTRGADRDTRQAPATAHHAGEVLGKALQSQRGGA